MPYLGPKGDVLKLAEIPRQELTLRFISNYYDGPIEGLVAYQDRLCAFSCFEEDIPGQSLYVLEALSEEELEHERYWKDLF
ncbi:MAG: hypothetical protein AAFN13_16300, partial [Bacteroidota bacterium]